MRYYRYIVGKTNDKKVRRRGFRSIKSAVAYLGRLKDQAGVIDGQYYIDGPIRKRR